MYRFIRAGGAEQNMQHGSLRGVSMRPEHVSQGLRLQHMLLTVLLATTFFVSISDRNIANAGSANAEIKVSARVLAWTGFKILNQIKEVMITSADIRKGYIEIKSASRIEIKSNDPAGYMLIFQGITWPFREIYLQGLTNEIQISSGNTFVRQPYNRGAMTVELDYRFLLAEDAKPGIYAWPLSISCQTI